MSRRIARCFVGLEWTPRQTRLHSGTSTWRPTLTFSVRFIYIFCLHHSICTVSWLESPITTHLWAPPGVEGPQPHTDPGDKGSSEGVASYCSQVVDQRQKVRNLSSMLQDILSMFLNHPYFSPLHHICLLRGVCIVSVMLMHLTLLW